MPITIPIGSIGMKNDIYNIGTYILYLENRINILEDQVQKIIKWVDSVDSELDGKK